MAANDGMTGRAPEIQTEPKHAPWCPRCEHRGACRLLKRRMETGSKADGCYRYSTEPAEKHKATRYPSHDYQWTRRDAKCSQKYW